MKYVITKVDDENKNTLDKEKWFINRTNEKNKIKTKESLMLAIDSFSDLEDNWGSYNEDEITVPSMITACKVIEMLPEIVDIETVNVFPMRDGGVQIDVGEFTEIEVLNYDVTQINFDNALNILNKYSYTLE